MMLLRAISFQIYNIICANNNTVQMQFAFHFSSFCTELASYYFPNVIFTPECQTEKKQMKISGASPNATFHTQIILAKN